MKDIGVYIHIPFCESKCPYCDFYSINDKNEYDNYIEHLCKAIVSFSEKYNRDVDTIYFGGGTPSLLGNNRLIKIINCIKTNFNVQNNAEVTIEVNPSSAQEIDFKKLNDSGFNRLSIGMQSSNNEELKILGRKHNRYDVENTIKLAKLAGFDNISLDLMLCIPNQTIDSMKESIHFCKICGVTHISAYILKYEKNTSFYKMKKQLSQFDDDKQADFYIQAVNEIESLGFKQYEISNFALNNYEGKHNLHYWRDEEYIGIGPSAHSFINNKRFYYERDITSFYKDILIDDTNGGDIYEYIMLKLRLREGLMLQKLNTKFDYKPTDKLYKAVEKLKENKLIDIKNDTISLTKQGFLVSNSVIGFILDNL